MKMVDPDKKKDGKPFWESKTFWTNVVIVLLVFFTSLEDMLTTGQTVSVIALINLVLRAVTSSKVTWFK